MKHEIKIRPEFYKAVIAGMKTFEIRLDDRNYEVGDEGEHLYVAYGGDKLTAGVKDKLATMAEEVGLKAGCASADFSKGDSVGMMVK